MPSNLIVLVIDRLSSGHLGPYGNTWLDTPSFNRLASEAVLFENAWANALDLKTIYRAYWQGIGAGRQGEQASGPNMIDQVRDAGTKCTLLTDAKQLVDWDLAASFDEQVFIPSTEIVRPAAGLEETQIARVVSATLDWLASASAPFLLWVHAQAMQGPWDAPLELRQQFAEEGDPPPSDCVTPPDEAWEGTVDPDRLLTFTHAYAGNVVAIDICLAPLLDALEQAPLADTTALITTSPRGFPLGEHHRLGPCGDDLYAESLQVPLLLRQTAPPRDAERIFHLIHPADLCSTAANLLIPASPRPESGNDVSRLDVTADQATQCPTEYVCSTDGARWSIRTRYWFFRDSDPPQLYVKPEDRFEVNEVADRCSDVVELFQQFLQQIQTSDPSQSPQLPAELLVEPE